MLVDHPHRKKIEEDLQSANKANPDDGYPSGLKNIIITATTPNIVGQPAGGIIGNTVQYSYVPKSDADLIEIGVAEQFKPDTVYISCSLVTFKDNI